MNQAGRKIIVATVALCSLAYGSYGKKKKTPKHKPLVNPKAVLIQLSTRGNRIDFFGSKNKLARIAAEDSIATSENGKMVADFRDNFSYCPVYFFYDTNAHRIKQHQFDDILMDVNLKTVNTIAFNPSDSNYIIAYWGKMVADELPSRKKDAAGNQAGNNVMSQQNRLVLMDHRYKTLGRLKGNRSPAGRLTFVLNRLSH
jgi:hypothetical protein